MKYKPPSVAVIIFILTSCVIAVQSDEDENGMKNEYIIWPNFDCINMYVINSQIINTTAAIMVVVMIITGRSLGGFVAKCSATCI